MYKNKISCKSCFCVSYQQQCLSQFVSSQVMAKSIGVHDIGGLEDEFGPIDTREYGYQLWEMQVILS